MPKNKKFSFLKSFGAAAHRNENGEFTLRKIGLTAQRLKTDPAFIRTRENAAEFGHAATVAGLIRCGFGPSLKNIAHPQLISDFVKLVTQVVHSDATNRRGERTVVNGDLSLFEGYQFNAQKQPATHSIPLTVKWQKAKSRLSVTMKAFNPKAFHFHYPTYATHVTVSPVLVAINPKQPSVRLFPTTPFQPISITREHIPPKTLSTDILTPDPFIILVAVCIECYTYDNGIFSLSADTQFNSLTIVKALHS